MVHNLKIWPQNYARIVDGTMNFQVRNNDRGFQYGDTVVLKEYDPEPVTKTNPDIAKGYVEGSKHLTFTVGYVHVLDSRNVVFSLLPAKENKTQRAKK